ncbi:YkgJ family cysteine cluster protein [Candidatus Magnetomonas plexicatena]|uniref:YkgJ family cysteine cluster protein n=1 Tax=Candidatus Magnetomonas plexicatena TaxID=2552947 RepID=UPI001C793670|nr:YkgJ family cysteine cluster protein [Nitrospirales bacterium LBB_01]
MDDVFNKLRSYPGEKIELTYKDKFSFRCYSGIECFNQCCRGGLEIFLTPYDVLRMKNAIGITSTEFLATYAIHVMLEKSNIPFLKLRMDENKNCYFNRQTGCAIYSDRPLVCRYYPIGYAVMKSNRPLEGDDFYFKIQESFCKGHKETALWDIETWRTDQEINIYEDANKDWVDLVLNKKLYGATVKLNDKTTAMYMLGSFDVDAFREFLLNSTFLKRFDVEEDELELITTDELQLLKFANKWLKFALFNEPTMYLKEAK